MTVISAINHLQVFFEATGYFLGGRDRVGGTDIDPVDEQGVPDDVDDQCPGRQGDGVRQRQAAKGRLQRGLDLDNAGLDVDVRLEHQSHDIQVGLDQFDEEYRQVHEVIEYHPR